MSYYSPTYFSATYFDVAAVPPVAPPLAPLGPSSYYFCDDYFDPTYFDSGPCVTPPPTSTLGRHVRGRRTEFIETPEPEDQTALILLTTGGRYG